MASELNADDAISLEARETRVKIEHESENEGFELESKIQIAPVQTMFLSTENTVVKTEIESDCEGFEEQIVPETVMEQSIVIGNTDYINKEIESVSEQIRLQSEEDVVLGIKYSAYLNKKDVVLKNRIEEEHRRIINMEQCLSSIGADPPTESPVDLTSKRITTSESTLPVRQRLREESSSLETPGASHVQKCVSDGDLDEQNLPQLEESLYQCSVCGKSFAKKATWQKHKFKHSGKPPHICQVCGRSFIYGPDLRKHERIHSGERPYACSVCGKSFTHQGSLQRHEFTHRTERPHSCSDCGMSFATKEYLLRHRLTHTGERPHKCYVCGKSFGKIGGLRRHESTHTGERPHNCYECGMNFATKEYLTQHQRIHTGERPFKCTECDKCFIRKQSLMKHAETHLRTRHVQ